VGLSNGSTGIITVNGTNSLFSMGGPGIVGVSGGGALVVTNGGRFISFVTELAKSPGSTGSLVVDGPGSSAVASGVLYVGGEVGQAGGAGYVTVQNSGTLQVAPLFYLASNSVVTLDSTGEIGVGTGFGGPGILYVTKGGKLFGFGKVQGQVVVAQGGIFVPGGSPGIFTIEGNFQEQAGGEMDVFIGGPDPGTGYSQVNVTGTATIGGTLNVIVLNGYSPSSGQTFSILNAAAASGTFAQVNGASITYGPTGVTLGHVTGVTSAPELSIQTENGNAVVTWPEAAQGYNLQTSSTLLSNSWSVVPATENTYVTPANSSPAFFRLVR
jgi:T5SS/PEP-CTERM-associated repeat protein